MFLNEIHFTIEKRVRNGETFFSTELGNSTQNTSTSTKSKPVQSRLHYLPKVFSSESKVHNKWAKISPFLPQKQPFVFRLIRSPIAADTGKRHRNKIAPDPGYTTLI